MVCKCLLQKHPKPMWQLTKSPFLLSGLLRWPLNLLGFNISFYKFHLVWSAEMSKSQIVTFPFLAYYIRDFFKKTWRDHYSMITHVFSNFQVPKLLEKNYAKKSDFVLFWNGSIWDGINKHVHILFYYFLVF